MKQVLPLALVGALVAAPALATEPTTDEAPVTNGEVELARLLEGREAGEPVRCLRRSQRDGLQIVDGGERIKRGHTNGPIKVALPDGYLDDPELSAETLDEKGWLHTGDIGVMDPRGNLAITDRLKDMFICGGFNAYPAEIERCLLRHPDVVDVAVIGVPDPRLGEVGKAFVMPRAGPVDAEALIAWTRERLANFKVPRHVQNVEHLPRNASGKVLKYALREHP